MFLRKYWIPFSVLLIAVACFGVYLFVKQPPKEPIKIYKAVEPLPKSTQQPKAEVSAIGDTSQDGHVHTDGDPFDAQLHDAPVEYLSEAELAEILEDMPEPDLQLPDDLVDAKELSRFMQKHTVEWQKYIHALNPRIERLSKEIDQMMEELPPENSPDFAAAKAKLRAKQEEHRKLRAEQNARTHQAVASAENLFADYRARRANRK